MSCSFVPFAGIGPAPADWFLERVSLADKAATDRAFDRWRRLVAEGWDVTALVDAAATHMIGLGVLYPGQMAFRFKNEATIGRLTACEGLTWVEGRGAA